MHRPPVCHAGRGTSASKPSPATLVRQQRRSFGRTETRMRIRVVCRLLCLGAAAAVASQAQATWKPEYANNPPEVQDWYRNAELTEAAKIRFPFKKCCDH